MPEFQHEVVRRRTEISSVGPSEARVSEILSALSYALDITEGQPEGHAARSCLIGMKLAEIVGLDSTERYALFYALLLKDLGCSSNAAKICALFDSDDRSTKRDIKTVDWARLWPSFRYIVRNAAPHGTLFERVAQVLRVAVGGGPAGAREIFQIRCERGADIALMLGLPVETAEAIRALDEHWNGKGHPRGLSGTEIPLLGRIAGLSQTIEVFLARDGYDGAMDMARSRSGRWFDPELVAALRLISPSDPIWRSRSLAELSQAVQAVEPTDRIVHADDEWLDRIAEAFARVIDAKSPWTAEHSSNVAELACGVGERLDLSGSELRNLRRAGLLHDIGKLGVSNRIWDKDSDLTDEEYALVRTHPTFTRQILSRVGSFASFCDIAASHHERLDGRGYDRGLTGDQLDTACRALIVADIFDALSNDRPYRKGQSPEEVFHLLAGDVGTALCPAAFDALRDFVATRSSANPQVEPAESPEWGVGPAAAFR